MAYTVRVGNSKMKVRSPWAPIVLGIITLGIYSFVWYYKVNKEMKHFGEAVNDPELAESSPGMSLLAITLGIVLIIPPFWSWINTVGRIQRTQRLSGQQPIEWPLIILLLIIPFAYLALYYMYQGRLNAAWINASQTDPQALARGTAAVPAPQIPR